MNAYLRIYTRVRKYVSTREGDTAVPVKKDTSLSVIGCIVLVCYILYVETFSQGWAVVPVQCWSRSRKAMGLGPGQGLIPTGQSGRGEKSVPHSCPAEQARPGRKTAELSRSVSFPSLVLALKIDMR